MQITGPLSSRWIRLFECDSQVFYKQPRWFCCTVTWRTLFQSSLRAVPRVSSKTKSDHVTPAEDNPGGPAYRTVSKLPGLVVRALHRLAFACSSLFPHLSLPWTLGFSTVLQLWCAQYCLHSLPTPPESDKLVLIIWGPVQVSLLWSHLWLTPLYTVVQRLGSQIDLGCSLSSATSWQYFRKVLDFSGSQSYHLENEDKSSVSWDCEM